MDVGVRELKQRLSEYLDRVEAGEDVVVTDRGRPKARLVPISERGGLQRGIDEGWISPPQHERAVGSVQRHRSTKRIVDVLDDDRG